MRTSDSNFLFDEDWLNWKNLIQHKQKQDIHLASSFKANRVFGASIKRKSALKMFNFYPSGIHSWDFPLTFLMLHQTKDRGVIYIFTKLLFYLNKEHLICQDVKNMKYLHAFMTY